MDDLILRTPGFPLRVERDIKNASGVKIDGSKTCIVIASCSPISLAVEYSYQQRPFIKLSWQMEDSKHVDFECVRVRSNSLVSFQSVDDLE